MNSKIEIYIDGPSEDEMKSLSDNKVKGYTFNPTLFKNLGVKDYIQHSKKIIKLSNGLPISLEVIGDNYDELIYQSKKLSLLGENVYVKIPITLTNGASTKDVINELVSNKIKLNITAIFTLSQIKNILDTVKDTETILSVFAGRIYDIGMNAPDLLKEIAEYIHSNSKCKLLWASPRMHYDYISAKNVGCDIITMNHKMFKKLSLIGKDPLDYSLDTVKMFYNDAKESGFEI